MDMTIRHNGFEMSEAIQSHVEDRLTAALNQHDSHVRRVGVTLRDENGPRGGVDMSCMVQIDLAIQNDPVVIKKQHEDIYLAITETADAVKRTVGRLVNKKARDRR